MLMNLEPSVLAIIVPLFMISIGLHEAAHAYTAAYFGDDTPAKEGRLTLNPLAHLDLFGSLMLLMAGFGWGKSVNVDPRNLRNPTWNMPLIAAAGPISNLLQAIVALLLLKVVAHTSLSFLNDALGLAIWLNIFLMFLNLIPIPPLDGSKVLRPLLPLQAGRKYDEWAPYGIIIFMGLIFLPGIGPIFNGTLQNLVHGTIGVLSGLVGLG